MKKLVLVLALVFMVSVANAAMIGLNTVTTGQMTWAVGPNPYLMVPYTTVLIGNSTVAGPWAGAVSSGGMSFFPPPNTAVAPVPPQNTGTGDWTGSHTAAAGDFASVIWATWGAAWDVVASDSGLGAGYGTGDFFIFGLQYGASYAMPLYIDVYDYNIGFSPVGTITVVPEPMTIALLGLGGLFLARRKK